MGISISIAICDDQPEFIDNLNVLLDAFDWTAARRLCTDCFTSSSELLSSVHTNAKKYDIVFLDIELKDALGFNVGTAIKSLLPDTLLIYVSSYTKYATDLLKAEPFYFLQKPVLAHELHTVLRRGIERIRLRKRDYVYTYTADGIECGINLLDVVYMKSEHRVIYLHTTLNEGIIRYYEKLDNVEREISKICNFYLRPNKSVLINAHFIDTINRKQIVIGNNEFPITDNYRSDFFFNFAQID